MSRYPSQSLNHAEVVRVRTLEWLTQVAPVASNRMRNLAEFLPPGYMTNCFWEATSGDKETTHKIKAINNAESIANFFTKVTLSNTAPKHSKDHVAVFRHVVELGEAFFEPFTTLALCSGWRLCHMCLERIPKSMNP